MTTVDKSDSEPPANLRVKQRDEGPRINLPARPNWGISPTRPAFGDEESHSELHPRHNLLRSPR